jgi:hypothetical protein
MNNNRNKQINIDDEKTTTIETTNQLTNSITTLDLSGKNNNDSNNNNSNNNNNNNNNDSNNNNSNNNKNNNNNYNNNNNKNNNNSINSNNNNELNKIIEKNDLEKNKIIIIENNITLKQEKVNLNDVAGSISFLDIENNNICTTSSELLAQSLQNFSNLNSNLKIENKEKNENNILDVQLLIKNCSHSKFKMFYLLLLLLFFF